MKYDRLTRFVHIEVKGVEYSLRLTLGMFEEIEDALPKGTTLVSMFLNNETPQIRVLRKAFCLALTKDGKKVADPRQVFEQYCDEKGIQIVIQTFYAVLAASHLLGAAASNEMLENLGLVVKDEEEVEEKNA